MFYFPLLDDHEEGDVQLTESQAGERAAELIKDKWPDSKYVLEKAAIEVVHPNWMYTRYWNGSGNVRYCDVTRLAWSMTYSQMQDSGFVSKIMIYVDFYTGEILGGDAAK